MPWLLRILNLIQKEVRVIFKDPANRVILLLPVMVQTVLFGYAATFDLNRVPYAVLDESHSISAQNMLTHLESSSTFKRVATLTSVRQMANPIDLGDALMVIHFPQDFERNLLQGKITPVQLIIDARNATMAASALAAVSTVIEAYNAEIKVQYGLPASTLQVDTRAWFNPNLETRWNILPGLIAALSMMQTLLLTALSVAREREQGTFDQLLVTPMTPFEILVGKAIPPVGVGMMQATIVLQIVLFWFKIPFAGNYFVLYLGLFFFTVASIGVGLSISALSRNMQEAMLYTFVILMPMILLSGFATPIENMPRALQIATYANPLRFAVDYVRRVFLEGVPLSAVAHDLLPLTIITLITMPIAAWLFRNRLV